MGHNLLINGVYWGYNPLILTIDPNFQRDIQVPLSLQACSRATQDATHLASSKAPQRAGPRRFQCQSVLAAFDRYIQTVVNR